MSGVERSCKIYDVDGSVDADVYVGIQMRSVDVRQMLQGVDADENVDAVEDVRRQLHMHA